MDTRVAVDGRLPNEGPNVFDDPVLNEAMCDTLDAFAEYSHLNLSNLLIVESRLVIKPAE
jgi:hypothetical protein